MEVIFQIMIVCTGLTAIYLTQQSNESLKKYACLFGMAGQPFWLLSAAYAQQWGIFLLSVCYTFTWAVGVNRHWIDPWMVRRRAT